MAPPSRPSRTTAVVAILATILAGCATTGSITEVSGAPASAGGSSTTAPVPPTTSGPGGVGDGSTTSSSTKRSTTTPSSEDPTDESTTTSEAERPEACDLITEADATEAFGEPAVAGTQGTDECWWSSANDLKTVNLIRREGDIDTWRSGYQNDYWESIELGDEGYAGTALDSITFRIADTAYEINVVYSTAGDPKGVVKSLAEKVASRL